MSEKMRLLWFAAVASVVIPNAQASAQLTDQFLLLPEKADVLVVGAHPDDEGIFFGGTLPYYSRVLDLSTVLVSMTSGTSATGGGGPLTREIELINAAKVYGLKYEPIFARFQDCCHIGPTEGSFAAWSQSGSDAEEGQARAVRYLAGQIRALKPEVVVGHDLEGEYGHSNHKASGLTTAAAFDLAADKSVVLFDASGNSLLAWQAQKLYTHIDTTNPDRLFHTGWNTSEAALGGSTAIEIADLALFEHVSQQGGTKFRVETFNLNPDDTAADPQLSESTRPDHDPWADYYSEGWGLNKRAPGVPLDSTTSGVVGTAHYGDFLENIVFRDGDINSSGAIDVDDYVVLNSNLYSGLLEGLSFAQAYEKGDLNGDLLIDHLDFIRFKELYLVANPAAVSLPLLNTVPEPANIALISVTIVCQTFLRSRRGRGGIC